MATSVTLTTNNASTEYLLELGARGPIGATGPQGVQGIPGAAATITLGSVATGAAGSSASATNSGNSSAATFNFTIPRGDVGATGPSGDTSVIAFETVATTTRTLTPTDAGKKFRFTNAAGCAITIQPDASGAWTAGQIVYCRRVTGAGALTFDNTGITINGNAISEVLTGEEFALHQVAANTFDFI